MEELESKYGEYAERAQQEYLARKKDSEGAFAKEREEFAKEYAGWKKMSDGIIKETKELLPQTVL